MIKNILLFFSIFSFSFSAININSTTLYKDSKELGEFYSCTFESEAEKDKKILREKKYLMEKDEFQYFFAKNNKNGIAYKANYNTPFGYVVSFKAFCDNNYISINGDYNNFNELLALFLKETKNLGYEF